MASTASRANIGKMTVAELKQHLKEEGLPVTGTKPVLVKRAQLSMLSEQELKSQAGAGGSGEGLTKRQLIKRLEENDESQRNQMEVDSESEESSDSDDGGDWFAMPDYKCRKCKVDVKPKDVENHLYQCWLDKSAASKKALVLIAQGFRGVMGVYMIFSPESTFLDLDYLLRDVWMEPCCSHMSQFWFEPNSAPFEAPTPYRSGSVVINTMSWDDTQSRLPKDTTKLTEVLKTKDCCISYEYDTGTTTQLCICFDGMYALKTNPTAPKEGCVVLRSNLPKIPCGKCDKLAKFVENDGGLEYSGRRSFFCSKRCAKGVSPEMLSKLCNSPRSGACGYPTC